jgi:hypothetical protein
MNKSFRWSPRYVLDLEEIETGLELQLEVLNILEY